MPSTLADYEINPDAARSYADAVVDTHGFPVLRDAVRARLSLTKEEEARLLEKWSAHSCLQWLDMRENPREPPDELEELKFYALLGVPDEFRPDVWRRLCEDVHGVIMVENEYETLVDMHAGEVTVATADIDRDVDRTFPSNLAFMSTCREELRRVLTALSFKFPHIGYCQGMNFVCGMLLLLLEEEDAFWVMVTILTVLTPTYYSGNLAGNMADQMVLEGLLREHLPACNEALQSNEVTLDMVATQWLLSLFVNALPTETVLRVWDIFFFDGREALMRVALAMFLQARDELVHAENAMEVVGALNRVLIAAFDADSLIAAAYGNFESVTMKVIDELTSDAMAKLYADQSNNHRRDEMKQLHQSTHFTVAELKAMHRDFKLLADATTGGIKDCQTLSTVVKKNSPTNEANIPLLFHAFDLNQDRQIDFRELMHGLSTLCRGTVDERLELAFNCYDTNNTGFLEKGEVRNMVTFLLRSQFTITPSADVVEKHVTCIFEEADSDGDGKINFAEYSLGVKSIPLLTDCYQLITTGETSKTPTLHGQLPEKKDDLDAPLTARNRTGLTTVGTGSRREIAAEKRKKRMEAEQMIMSEHHMARELSRAQKSKGTRRTVWEELLANHLDDSCRPEGIHTAVLGGLPADLRPRIWNYFVTQNVSRNTKPGIYDNLQEFIEKNSTKILLPLELDDQVPEERDVLDQAGVAKGTEALRRVLLAVTNFLPHVGYMPGMHMLGAFLLLFVPEEDVFWLLVACVVGQTPISTEYTRTQPLSIPEVEATLSYTILWAKLTPQIREHLSSLQGLQPRLIQLIDSWLDRIFVGVVPPATAVRIWDCYLLLGPTALPRIAVALVLAAKECLLEASNTEEVITALSKVARLWPEPGALLAAAFKEDATGFKQQGLCGICLQEVGRVDVEWLEDLRSHHAQLQLLNNGNLSLLYGSRVDSIRHVAAPLQVSPRLRGRVVLAAAATNTQVWGLGDGGSDGGGGVAGGSRWNALTGQVLAPLQPQPGSTWEITCIADMGQGIWLGLKGGRIGRCTYTGDWLSPLNAHAADVQFIMKWSGTEALTGSLDGDLLLWSLQQIGREVGQPMKFQGDGKRYMCAVEIPASSQAWLGGPEGVAVFDGQKTSPMLTIEVNKGVTALAVVSGSEPEHAAVWAAGIDGAITVLEGTHMGPARQMGHVAHIIPAQKNGICCIVEVGTEVWSGHTDGTVRVYCRRTYGILRILGEHTTTVCCIVPIPEPVSRLTLAWVASEDGMVSMWVAEKMPTERQTIIAQNSPSHTTKNDERMTQSNSKDSKQGFVDGLFGGLTDRERQQASDERSAIVRRQNNATSAASAANGASGSSMAASLGKTALGMFSGGFSNPF